MHRADLAEAGAAEVARQFEHAALLLEGLALNADDLIGFAAGRILTDAKCFAERARKAAERHAREETA